MCLIYSYKFKKIIRTSYGITLDIVLLIFSFVFSGASHDILEKTSTDSQQTHVIKNKLLYKMGKISKSLQFLS